MKKDKLILMLILFLAAFLRFYRIVTYPPLNVDEAAIGYNAYSLIKTGRDEHGILWPLHFKSFGDYKPGGYFYLVLPFVAVLGLNELAVRLPSALAAIATVYLVYKLALLLWKRKRLALIWAFVLSVSPWHLHFSRGGWESNMAIFFIIWGIYLFFRNTYLLSGISFVYALYTYHSARVIIPVLIFSLLIFNWQQRKKFVFPAVFCFLLLLPLAASFLRGGASSRFSGVGIFADTGPIWRVNELLNQHQSGDFPVIRLIHNKVVIYTLSFFQKYFYHFDGRFLFIEGDQVPRSKLPDMGPLYIFEFIFLVLGICFWLREKKKYFYLPIFYLPILLLLVSPLASAFTFQAPSALRALLIVIPLTFFIAYGLDGIFNKKLLRLLIFALYIYGISFWQDQYFGHYLKRFPSAWPDFKPTAAWLNENAGNHERICISGQFDQPYILTLFYLKYPPEKIQKEIKLTEPDQFGFSTVKNFDKYYFGDCKDFNGKII